MKLAIIYDPECPKLRPEAYSQSYRDMFLALISRFESAQEITSDCSAVDIEADVIIFYDIHSSHHIKIDGIRNHSALKYEYFNDPHQESMRGIYKCGTHFDKLDAKRRCQRALSRGVNFIICPYTNGYYRYLHPHLEDGMFVWFPIAPKSRVRHIPLSDRKSDVLLSGHLWQGEYGFRPYHFRRWVSKQSYVANAQHVVKDENAPAGENYQRSLQDYAGALALSDSFIVPKYSEIPLVGCVSFAQYQPDYEKMGFKDNESCIYVTKSNIENKINDFKQDVTAYQPIADAGRKLMEDNWTSDHFADYIYKHSVKHGYN